MKEILERIEKLKCNKKDIVIAIDGMSGAGKTTLANMLKDELDANIISCDDFFLPSNLRTIYRLKEVGGNIDYDRLYNEVILRIRKNLSFKRYDCKTNSFNEEVKLQHKKITIVEGAYSMHPYFGEYYDLAIFMEIDKETQEKIISERNKENSSDFFEKWIPYENKYFDVYKIKNRAHIIKKGV